MAVPAITRPIAAAQTVAAQAAAPQMVVAQPAAERQRSLWPLTLALAAIMVVLILVLWVVVQGATTL